MGYIYKITNKINNKSYIGQTTKNSINDRFGGHIKCAKAHINRYLYDAMNHYGYENFTIELLEECDNSILDSREIYYISLLHTFIGDPYCNGYNMTIGGGGGATWRNGLELFIHCENLREKRLKDEYIPITKELLEDAVIHQKLSKNTILNNYKIASRHFDNSCSLFGINYDKNNVSRKVVEYKEPDYLELIDNIEIFKSDLVNFSLTGEQISKKYKISGYILDKICYKLYNNNFFEYREHYKLNILENIPNHGKNLDPTDINDINLLEYLLWYDFSSTYVSNYFYITDRTLRNKLKYLYNTEKLKDIKKMLHVKYTSNPMLPNSINIEDKKQVIVDKINYLKTHFDSSGKNNGMFKSIENWDYIESQFRQGVLLKDLARELNISRPTLSKKIKEKYNIKSIKEFKDYVKQE